MKKISIEDLIENDLGLRKGHINDLADKADMLYSRFDIGAKRIDVPSPGLKLVQCWISDFIRNVTNPIPSYVTAYEKGCSIKNNALLHSGNKHFLTLDISDFFHSCKASQVAYVLSNIEIETDVRGLRRLESDEIDSLTKLICYEERLCIGSPSSPLIANRIMQPIDVDIIGVLDGSMIYSRYSDDITISTNEWIDIKEVEKAVSNILLQHGFSLNKRKTKCLGTGDRRRITGVFVCPDGSLSIGSKRKKEIKNSLYNYLMYGKGDAARILGLIYFAIQIEPLWAARLLSKYANYGIAKNSSAIEALRC